MALEKALAALHEAGEYSLIGGFAAAIRGRLRFTQDLDFLSICRREDYGRLVSAFREQGFAHMDRADRHRLDDVDLLRFWLPVEGSDVSIGVDVQVARTDFLESTVRRAGEEDYHGLHIQVARRADAMELASLPDSLDWDFLQARAAELKVSERLAEVRDSIASNSADPGDRSF